MGRAPTEAGVLLVIIWGGAEWETDEAGESAALVPMSCGCPPPRQEYKTEATSKRAAPPAIIAKVPAAARRFIGRSVRASRQDGRLLSAAQIRPSTEGRTARLLVRSGLQVKVASPLLPRNERGQSTSRSCR